MSNSTQVVSASIQGFPSWSETISFDLNDLVGPSLVPFSLAFLVPLFMFTIVLEKENRVREMMKMMGMRMSMYWAINYLFDYVMYLVVVLLFVAAELVAQVRLFTQTSVPLLLVFFFLSGHTLISLSFFLSSFFNKSALASCTFFFAFFLY
jgi:hypothetical protein